MHFIIKANPDRLFSTMMILSCYSFFPDMKIKSAGNNVANFNAAFVQLIKSEVVSDREDVPEFFFSAPDR